MGEFEILEMGGSRIKTQEGGEEELKIVGGKEKWMGRKGNREDQR